MYVALVEATRSRNKGTTNVSPITMSVWGPAPSLISELMERYGSADARWPLFSF